MTEHSRFSPSSAHRWIPCPGSMKLEEALPPQETSSYAEEGTAAHELAELILNSDEQDVWLYEGGESSNGYEFTHEMCEHITTYVKNILDYAEGNELFVEQRVDFSDSLGQPDAFGTADAIIQTGDELQIHDLKYGMGKVFAEENEQLMLYAIGALQDLGDVYINNVRLVIHQPRLGHLDEWLVSIEDLVDFAEKATVSATLISRDDTGVRQQYNPGPKQCQWCRAKATCPALEEFVEEATGVTFDNLDEVTPELSEDNIRIAELLPKLNLIVDWTKAVRAKAEAELLVGNDIPDYKLVAGKRGARKWVDPKEAEAEMKAMRLKLDEMYDKKVISPTTAEKLLKDSPRRWKRLAPIITQSEGKPSVVPVSDKRPVLDLTVKFDDLDDHSDLV